MLSFLHFGTNPKALEVIDAQSPGALASVCLLSQLHPVLHYLLIPPPGG